MQVISTSVASSYSLPGANRSQKTESAVSAPVANAGAGISSYDFSSMSPAELRSTVNDLIRSGRMTFDESSPLLGMMSPPASRWAGSGGPPADEANRMDNEPIDALATLREGITGAQARGNGRNVEALGRTLDALLRLQGTTASVDIRA